MADENGLIPRTWQMTAFEVRLVQTVSRQLGCSPSEVVRLAIKRFGDDVAAGRVHLERVPIRWKIVGIVDTREV